jgi:MraZ protein
MEPDATIGPVYNGEFRHGVDEKRRVQVPARWRPSKAGVELTMVLWPANKEGACLRVLPPTKMADLMVEIDAMAKGDPSKISLKRLIGRQSLQITPDSAGRVCLPDEMAKAAGITDQAVLVGLLDMFEIWNPERLEKVTASDQVMAQQAYKMMD